MPGAIMTFSAVGFAKSLWIAAAMLVFAEWIPVLTMTYPANGPGEPLRVMMILQTLGLNIQTGGILAALGAVVYLLGEIRDALTRRSL